ncbi:MAG: hypothetical protein NTY77_06350 [Elusimicrobia bacterium]|nr:hypothetical protein [Elusimicrobiota bacterium]
MMRVIALNGPKPKRILPTRERKLYALLKEHPEILEKDSHFRLLSINRRSEKGPDFIGVNNKGHMIIGEVKLRGLHQGAWDQAKSYAKRVGRMRENELDQYIKSRVKAGRGEAGSLRDLTRGLLGPAARLAFFNPSHRRVQLLLVAEDFPDDVLRDADRCNLGQNLRGLVKDVKCVQVQLYQAPARSTLAITSVLSGRHRRVKK